jgi:hypothetical protein
MTFSRLFTLLIALIAISIGSAFLHTLAFPDPVWPLEKGERIALLPGTSVTQSFTSSRDYLRQVEILFGKFTLQDDDRLTVELRDSQCIAVLAQTKLAYQSFDSEHTYAFVFDPLQHSHNETYCLALTFESDRTIEKTKAPRLFTDLAAQASPFTLTEKGMPIANTAPIAIRPGYQNSSLFTTLGELTDRISQYKPIFLKDGFLVTFAILGLVLTFLALIVLGRETRSLDEER